MTIFQSIQNWDGRAWLVTESLDVRLSNGPYWTKSQAMAESETDAAEAFSLQLKADGFSGK
jgi:hypothetical protein